jgi:hypothetical protein
MMPLQVNHVRKLFCANKQQQLLKTVSIRAKADVSLAHQLMALHCRDIPGLMLEPLFHHGMDITVQCDLEPI